MSLAGEEAPLVEVRGLRMHFPITEGIVARRKIGETPAHGLDFGAHGAKIDRGARIGPLAAHVIELERQRSNIVEQRLGERPRVRAAFGRRIARARTRLKRGRIPVGGRRRGRVGETDCTRV